MTDSEHSKYFPEYHYKTAYEWHRHWVFNDPEFVAKARKLFLEDGLDNNEVYILASDYSLHAVDIRYFCNGTWLEMPPDFPVDIPSP